MNNSLRGEKAFKMLNSSTGESGKRAQFTEVYKKPQGNFGELFY